MERKVIQIKHIEINLDRHEGGMGDMSALASSMERSGLINPISVALTAEDTYEIIAGRRRLEAAKSLGWTEIPATIYENGEAVEEEVQLAENVVRLDMHPLDEGVLYRKLIEGGVALYELMKLTGRSKSAIYQRMELLRLIPSMKDRFRSGALTMTQASMVGSLSVESQELFNAYLADCNQGGAIYEYQFCEGFRRYGGITLANGGFPACESCKTRTRFSDTTLFPELTGLSDQCLDRKCYEAQYIQWVREQVAAVYDAAKVSFDRILTPLLILEDASIDILASSMHDKTVLIRDVKFPVESSDSYIVIDEEEEEEEGGPFDECLHLVKNGFYIGRGLTIETVRYVLESDYLEWKGDSGKEDDEETAITVTSEEKNAYETVMRGSWDIERFARAKVLGQLALERFGTAVAPEFFRGMIDDTDRVNLIATAQAHDKDLEDTAVLDGHSWLAGRSLEWMKSFAYDLLLRASITGIYVPFGSPLSEKNRTLLAALELDPDDVIDAVRGEYKAEIRRRMDTLLDPPQKPEQEEETGEAAEEERAASAETFSERAGA